VCAWRYWAHQDQRRVPSGSRRAERKGIETIVVTVDMWTSVVTTEKYCK